MNHIVVEQPIKSPGVIQKIGKHHYFEHYNRLVVLVIVVNLTFLWYGLAVGQWWQSDRIQIAVISDLVLGNFAVAVIIRQQYLINGLFWIATRAPLHWPLAIRRTLGKVYHFGGLHSGSAAVGAVWYALFLHALVHHHTHKMPGVPEGILAISFGVMTLLLLMVIIAMPVIRRPYHNLFEKVHRFGGWSLLIFFWAQTLIFVQADGIKPYMSSSVWLLTLMTFSVLLPWLRLKKVCVDINSPSPHVAISKFNYGVTPFAGSSTSISRNPLLEWHSFANVPAPGLEGFRLTISRAGDWTQKFITDKPHHVWVKGIPTAGVANIEVLFKKVIYVATGSGIGPCLPHLLAKAVPAKLVWSTRSPRQTYGDTLVDEILAAVPDALIWDTSAQGKPDLVQLTYEAYHKFGAEAVICIANQPLTQTIVYAMESQDIPAYGAIWDS